MLEAEAARTAPEARQRALAELQRQAERVLDHEAQARESMDAKTQQMMTVGLAALAGGVTSVTFAVEKLEGRAGAGFVALAALAGLANLAGLALLTGAYLGFRDATEMAIGPDLHWLAKKAEDRTWTYEEPLANTLPAASEYSRFNRASSLQAARRRRWGVYAIGVAVAIYAVLGIYTFYHTLVGT